MSEIGKPERITQNRVIELFQQELNYHYLGNWEDREDNSNIEESLLTSYLKKQGHSAESINRVVYELKITANNHSNSLYLNNKNTYQLLMS